MDFSDQLTLTIKVAKLEMAPMIPVTMPQASFEPEAVAGWWMTGPPPPALTNAQMKRAMPAVGATTALTVKRWRILWTGNQMNGSEPSQKRKNEMK